MSTKTRDYKNIFNPFAIKIKVGYIVYIYIKVIKQVMNDNERNRRSKSALKVDYILLRKKSLLNYISKNKIALHR